MKLMWIFGSLECITKHLTHQNALHIALMNWIEDTGWLHVRLFSEYTPILYETICDTDETILYSNNAKK
jgi:hypothetical protein